MASSPVGDDTERGTSSLSTASTLQSPVCHPNQDYPRGQHPYPSGDEWDASLNGREFAVRVEYARVQARDGVWLDGTILRPVLPDGARAPVVLWSSPYLGTLDAPLDDPEQVAHSGGRVLPIDAWALARRGFAIAGFNVRGTRASGGCFDLWGEREQLDQYDLVEWLGRQTWSNGRVGMVGQSYDGTTALEAAVQNPPSLKTVIINSAVSDFYQSVITPQGAIFDDQVLATAPFGLALTTLPPRTNSDDVTASWRNTLGERLCPEVAGWLTADAQTATADVRNAAFYAERRLTDRLSHVRAAVLLTHGFQDHLAYSEDQIFNGLVNAPRWQLEGQWAHRMPAVAAFDDRMVRWLEFWLKGQGCLPGGVDQVDYQDSQGGWRLASSWPPAEARSEVLYVNRHGLRTSPGHNRDSVSFVSAPNRTQAQETIDYRTAVVRGPTPFCPNGALAAGAVPNSVTLASEPYELLFVTEPVQDAPVVLAGNPMAYLNISSDLPGGFVAIQLFALGPNFRCEDGVPVDYRFLTEADVDLRFYRGNMTGENFPMNHAVGVRADFQNLAEVLPVGYRLAAIVTAGAQKTRLLRPFTPRIRLHANGGNEGATHLVLPIVQGTFGGAAPTMSYPPRPFSPR